MVTRKRIIDYQAALFVHRIRRSHCKAFEPTSLFGFTEMFDSIEGNGGTSPDMHSILSLIGGAGNMALCSTRMGSVGGCQSAIR